MTKIRKTATTILKAQGLGRADLSLSLAGDRALRRLNRVYRGVDHATDVLSFPQDGPLPPVAGPHVLGDIVINLHAAERTAKELGHSVEEEFAVLFAHGLAHLLGHAHHRERDREKMRRVEERLLRQAGIRNASGLVERTQC